MLNVVNPNSAEVMPKACKVCGSIRWQLTYVVSGKATIIVVVCEGCDDAASA